MAEGRILDPANVASFINQIMKEHRLKSDDVRKLLRKINRKGTGVSVPGVGEFYCLDCNNGWRSYFAWILIDLVEISIPKRYLMKCKKCKRGRQPRFELDTLKLMTEKAVRLFTGEKNEYDQYKGHRSFVPHDSILCEKCQWGQIRCWEDWRRQKDIFRRGRDK